MNAAITDRKLTKQIVLYLAFGAIQFGLDCLLFAILVHSKIDLKYANVFTRFCAALAGFVLNGLFTFRSTQGKKLRFAALVRYVSLWVLLTLASTSLLVACSYLFGSERLPLAKVVVEAFLACVSFLVMKLWVYRVTPTPCL